MQTTFLHHYFEFYRDCSYERIVMVNCSQDCEGMSRFVKLLSCLKQTTCTRHSLARARGCPALWNSCLVWNRLQMYMYLTSPCTCIRVTVLYPWLWITLAEFARNVYITKTKRQLLQMNVTFVLPEKKWLPIRQIDRQMDAGQIHTDESL